MGMAAAGIVLVSVHAQGPTFRARVDLVQLDVAVLDKDHKPVKGLTATDFTVFEDEHAQEIVAFGAVDVPDAGPASSRPPQPAKWIEDVSPDVTTNHMDDRRLFVVVMDDAMILDDALMKKGAKDIANGVIDRMGPSDLMAIVFTRDNRNTQDFTADKAKLRAAVGKFSPGTVFMDSKLWDQRLPYQERAQKIITTPDSDIIYYEASVRTVVNVADALAAIPNRRKALVYISEGLPVDPEKAAEIALAGSRPPVAHYGGPPRSIALEAYNIHKDLTAEMTEAFRRAARANVAVYAFDPSPNGSDQALERFIAQQGPNKAGQPISEVARYVGGLTDDFLLATASNTGGRAVLRAVDAPAGIEQMFVENGSYYLLGYHSTSKKTDGFRRVQVKINREGSFDVRARNTYYVEKPPDPKKAAAPPEAKAMAGLLADPGVALEVVVAPFAKPDGTGNAVAITLGVSQPAPIERTVERVDLLARAFTPEGDARGQHAQTVSLALRGGASPTEPAQYELLSQMDLKPGRYEMRFSVHNDVLAKDGSVYADVIVPDFAKVPLSLSGVALMVAEGHAAAPRATLATLIPVEPTAQRTFARSDRVSAFVRVYQGGDKPLSDVALAVTIVNDHDEKMIDASDTLNPAAFTASTRSADQNFSVPVDKLPPGAYLLTVTASAGPTTAHRDVRFTVR